MTKRYALGAASLAIMVSLSSTAQAQDSVANGEVLNVSSAQGDVISAAGAVTPMAVTESTLDPNYRDIIAFDGDVQAYWRDINPFYRDILAFDGEVDPYWRDINPFYRDISAFWGDINAFWRDISAFDAANMAAVGDHWKVTGEHFQRIEALWSKLENGHDEATALALQAEIDALILTARGQWGGKIKEETGLWFNGGFANEFFARHGVHWNKLQVWSNKSAAERAAFYLDWHDTLMGFAGIDHVDHWMASVNWTPALTQIQGSGGDTVIGIIDGSLIADPDLMDNVVWSGGMAEDLNGHGAGVASLIYAAHDGEGVMGIAPNAKVATYNPFGADGTSDWDAVSLGIMELKDRTNEVTYQDHYGWGTSIINLSLGEAGWTLSQGAADVFTDSWHQWNNTDTVYVVAAGNDGVSQTADLNWDFYYDPALIIVGSVNSRGEISSFSNRPGTACLLDNGQCYAGNELYNRFVVAPGEQLLVADGHGGVVRRSGTSFAAPLVSGAIALLNDRWPWLANDPHAAAEIIFKSAEDLGAPGPDPVYGWGLLDVTASQAPLDFNNLRFYRYQKRPNGYHTANMSASSVRTAGAQSWWEADEVYFSLFETVGYSERDFIVPLSSVLYGQQTNVSGSLEYFQDFVATRFNNWLNSGGADADGDGKLGLTRGRGSDNVVPGGWTMKIDTQAPRFAEDGSVSMPHTAVSLTNPGGRVSFTMGSGQGSLALAGGRFDMVSDHHHSGGGVNPVLGFASGETFASATYKLDKNTSVTFGFSENREDLDEMVGLGVREAQALEGLDTHAAHAWTADIEHRVTDALSVNMQYTRLEEDTALLGTQATAAGVLSQGTSTDAISMAATLDMGKGFTLDVSATGARTDSGEDQSLATPNGVWSSAGQVSLGKRGVLGQRDRLRLSVAQPLTVEKAEIEFRSIAVVDRQTGELGVDVQTFDLESKRSVIGEVLYAAPLGRKAEVSMFGRYQSPTDTFETENYVFGANVNFRF